MLPMAIAYALFLDMRSHKKGGRAFPSRWEQTDKVHLPWLPALECRTVLNGIIIPLERMVEC
jgi:hypothetical protein